MPPPYDHGGSVGAGALPLLLFSFFSFFLFLDAIYKTMNYIHVRVRNSGRSGGGSLSDDPKERSPTSGETVGYTFVAAPSGTTFFLRENRRRQMGHRTAPHRTSLYYIQRVTKKINLLTLSINRKKIHTLLYFVSIIYSLSKIWSKRFQFRFSSTINNEINLYDSYMRVSNRIMHKNLRKRILHKFWIFQVYIEKANETNERVEIIFCVPSKFKNFILGTSQRSSFHVFLFFEASIVFLL